MAARKVAVTVEAELIQEVDGWVAAGEFPSRSRAVREGLIALQRQRAGRGSLLGELAKLDPAKERESAEEWLAGETF